MLRVESLESRRLLCYDSFASVESPPDDFDHIDADVIVTYSIREDIFAPFEDENINGNGTGHAMEVFAAENVGDQNGDGFDDIGLIAHYDYETTQIATLVYGSAEPLHLTEACLQSEPLYKKFWRSQLVTGFSPRTDGLAIEFGDGTIAPWEGEPLPQGNLVDVGEFDFNGDGAADTLIVEADHVQVHFGDPPAAELTPGDTDGNGAVDFADFLTLSANFGAVDAVWADGDFDGSGGVDFADFLLLSQNFGVTSEA